MGSNTIHDIPVYRKGFGLKEEVSNFLHQDYHSELVVYLQEHDYHLDTPQVEILLAREFGFCYGVDRAVDYAYEARQKFPDRRLFLTAEIIHNPRVNRRLVEMGIRFLSGQYADGMNPDLLQPGDVVILPAFGVSIRELDHLRSKGCILVDTTCGSVASVWKRVERYAREGYTSLIHGKHRHEETIATCSRAESVPGGKYLVVRDLTQADKVGDFIRGKQSADEFMQSFRDVASDDFDPQQHLQKVGVANQTTMLSSESLEIAARIRSAFVDRYGEEETKQRFLSFDTICSATQERQDAVIELTRHQLDLMLVVGGFNSSNTGHLCEIGLEHCPTYHIDEASRIEGAARITHKRRGQSELTVTENWLPDRKCRIGFTAGASTPNQVIGEVISLVLNLKGVDPSFFVSGRNQG